MPAVDHRQLGAGLREARLAAGMSRQQAAEALGVHWNTIGAIERGAGGAAWDTVARYAALLKHPLADVLPVTTEVPTPDGAAAAHADGEAA